MPNLRIWGMGGVVAALVIGGGLAAIYWGPGFDARDLDDSEPPRPATIAVSDPQIYARETLINDRREEFEYLSKLLAKSADPAEVRFSPQVFRDISVMEAFRNQLGLQFGGDSNPKSEQPKSSPADDKADATKRLPPSGATSSPQEEFRDRQAYRGDLRAALASVNLDDLHDLGGNALFRLQFKVGTFPGEIKNKFGAAQLTIQRLELKRAEIDTIYRAWLGHLTSRINYFDKAGKLGTAQQYVAGLEPYVKLLKLDVSKKSGQPESCLLRNKPLSERLEACHTLSLAVPPDLPSPDWMYPPSPDLVSSVTDLMNVELLLRDTAAACRDPASSEKLRAAIVTAEAFLKIEPALRAALDGLIAGSDPITRRRLGSSGPAGGLPDQQDAQDKYQNLNLATEELRAFLGEVGSAADSVLNVATSGRLQACNVPVLSKPAKGIETPDRFVESLTDAGDSTHNRLAKGNAYAFGTTPMELAQRLSTTASTAASMELAVALAAKLKTEMGGAQAASNYMRSVGQTAASLERLPLVIGFSDRTKESAKAELNSPGVAKFGWIFGPKARLDATQQRFVFEQSVGSYDVAADISVPSWWPRVDLKVETAWIANWYGASVLGQAKDTKSMRLISVPLPLNRADLDGLTKFLMKDVRRPTETTAISSVEPTVISACANDVTILIYGANVWRSAEVYLGGVRSTEIKVLPDMEGISAKFNMADFYKNTNMHTNRLGFEEAILRINTRNGKDFRIIRVVGDRDPVRVTDAKEAPPVNCKSPHSIAGPFLLNPAIFAVAPAELCSDDTRFVLTGRNLMGQRREDLSLTPPRVFLNGQEGTPERVGASPGVDDMQVIVVTFEKPLMPRAAGGQLIVLNESGFATANLGSCHVPKKGGGALPPPSSAPPTPLAPQGGAP